MALKAHLPLREDGIMKAFVSPPMSAEDALCILKDWLVYLQAPDTTRWRLTRDTAIIFPPKAVTARNQQMILVGKTTQRFVSFSRKDVQTAAADLISGRLQSVEITYMEHALWIQCATHKDEDCLLYTSDAADD